MPIRLKIEINTREIEAFDARTALPLDVMNSWFSGTTAIPTFSREEMLATKLRALLQRDRGRDLYDLAHALDVFEGLDTDRIVEMFGRYLALAGQAISRAQAVRSACSPSSPIRASCSMCAHCCRPLGRKL